MVSPLLRRQVLPDGHHSLGPQRLAATALDAWQGVTEDPWGDTQPSVGSPRLLRPTADSSALAIRLAAPRTQRPWRTLVLQAPAGLLLAAACCPAPDVAGTG